MLMAWMQRLRGSIEANVDNELGEQAAVAYGELGEGTLGGLVKFEDKAQATETQHDESVRICLWTMRQDF